MSTYTTTIWETLKDLNDYEPENIYEMIEKHRNKIFNFSYETPNKIDKNEFKKWFETSFITKFLTYEIGSETFELFQMRLASTCMRIMPIYSRMIDNIVSVAPRDLFHGQYGDVKKESSDEIIDKGNSKSMGSTLPINMISSNAIEDVDYADVSSKNESDNTRNDKYNDKTEYNLTYFVDITGLMNINQETRKVYNDLFNEFEYLFLGVL